MMRRSSSPPSPCSSGSSSTSVSIDSRRISSIGRGGSSCEPDRAAAATAFSSSGSVMVDDTTTGSGFGKRCARSSARARRSTRRSRDAGVPPGPTVPRASLARGRVLPAASSLRSSCCDMYADSSALRRARLSACASADAVTAVAAAAGCVAFRKDGGARCSACDDGACVRRERIACSLRCWRSSFDDAAGFSRFAAAFSSAVDGRTSTGRVASQRATYAACTPSTVASASRDDARHSSNTPCICIRSSRVRSGIRRPAPNATSLLLRWLRSTADAPAMAPTHRHTSWRRANLSSVSASSRACAIQLSRPARRFAVTKLASDSGVTVRDGSRCRTPQRSRSCFRSRTHERMRSFRLSKGPASLNRSSILSSSVSGAGASGSGSRTSTAPAENETPPVRALLTSCTAAPHSFAVRRTIASAVSRAPAASRIAVPVDDAADDATLAARAVECRDAPSTRIDDGAAVCTGVPGIAADDTDATDPARTETPPPPPAARATRALLAGRRSGRLSIPDGKAAAPRPLPRPSPPPPSSIRKVRRKWEREWCRVAPMKYRY
eukprot:Rhum_TRINITY_DN14679_c30_g1::Rhum_TRINITY_DN14679_c30_g1_i1::g.110457::m.110457